MEFCNRVARQALLSTRPPDLVIDVLVKYDPTGRLSQNQEKLEGLDKFLNIGHHLVKHPNRLPRQIRVMTRWL